MRDIIFDVINLTCNIIMIVCLIILINKMNKKEEV